jgi:hypothetical protein
MIFKTMIPVNYNDGSPVGAMALEGIYRHAWAKFGGCTVDAVADGYWHDDDGKLYCDKVRRATVYVENNSEANLNYARMMVRKIGVLLKQNVMYFEHDYCGDVEVEFLTVDPAEDFHSAEPPLTLADMYEREEQLARNPKMRDEVS